MFRGQLAGNFYLSQQTFTLYLEGGRCQFLSCSVCFSISVGVEIQLGVCLEYFVVD